MKNREIATRAVSARTAGQKCETLTEVFIRFQARVLVQTAYDEVIREPLRMLLRAARYSQAPVHLSRRGVLIRNGLSCDALPHDPRRSSLHPGHPGRLHEIDFHIAHHRREAVTSRHVAERQQLSERAAYGTRDAHGTTDDRECSCSCSAEREVRGAGLLVSSPSPADNWSSFTAALEVDRRSTSAPRGRRAHHAVDVAI